MMGVNEWKQSFQIKVEQTLRGESVGNAQVKSWPIRKGQLSVVNIIVFKIIMIR